LASSPCGHSDQLHEHSGCCLAAVLWQDLHSHLLIHQVYWKQQSHVPCTCTNPPAISVHQLS
jgi:hypothetical protein